MFGLFLIMARESRFIASFFKFAKHLMELPTLMSNFAADKLLIGKPSWGYWEAS